MSETPLRSRARLLGFVYLLYFVAAIWGGLLVKGFTVQGDAVATAHNFAVHQVAVRAASAMGLVSIALYLVLTALFYELFRPVSRRLSLIATLLSVAACTIQAFGDVFLAPLQMLAGSQGGFEMEELRSLAQASLAMHTQALQIALVLFGCFDLLIGILIVRSGFLPRIFGVLMVLAGFGWLIYLWPPLADELSRVVQPLGFLAEAVLLVWLLAKGVDEERWRALWVKRESRSSRCAEG
ncbi:DUF4386 domain-containing protein [Granulicella arctica]|uniref:DUF4386 domain-containing protein n=1 Tax=Granulicella arctica TaxID=940613 RepID=A0A7Y9TGR0_9BACT|nr:DUF4386 domain-containing protein [Granulicella arctica]NYF80186.1 hypothetical protein [Granulicella arctica]